MLLPLVDEARAGLARVRGVGAGNQEVRNQRGLSTPLGSARNHRHLGPDAPSP